MSARQLVDYYLDELTAMYSDAMFIGVGVDDEGEHVKVVAPRARSAILFNGLRVVCVVCSG